ncbi:MAG: two-component system sensor histidine kinase NtrB [Desulfobulbaceae bacterium]
MKRLMFWRTIKSFSGKVFACLLGTVILLTCTLNLLSLRGQQQNFTSQIQKDGAILASVLANNARLGIFARDNRQLATAVRTTLDVEGIISACVFDRDGQLLLREAKPEWEQTAICRRNGKGSADFQKQLSSAQPVIHFEDDKTIEFRGKVLTGSDEFTGDSLYFQDDREPPAVPGKHIGYVGVVFDKEPILKYSKKILTRNLLILFVFLVLGSLAAYYIVQGVTRPLNELLSMVRAKGHGDQSRDDLDTLSDTFSTMIKDLGNSFATISELKTGLENKIGELEEEIRRRRMTEIDLRESEEKFRSISEGIADGVAIVRQGAFVWANRAFCTIFACSAAEVVGRDPEVLLPQPGKQPVNPWLLDCLGGAEKQVRYLTMTRRGDGQEILVEVKAQQIMFENQKSIQVIIRDVTEEDKAEARRKELEVKALAQSKLASLGKIATGVAHEINQPLSYIRIAYESALRDMEERRFDPAESKESFREALRQVGRIIMITEHLRNFGRADTSSFEEVLLPGVLNSSLTLMAEILRLANVTLEVDAAEDLPLIMGNSVQLEQVFINLFQNSTDAMGQADDKRIRVTMRLAGNMIETCFADSGPGIPLAARQKIFEPFYSTKSGEDRTGLGLAIVNSIVRGHGGTITYHELPGWGANFVILLPVGTEAAAGSSGALGQGADNI